ncbi:MAG: hypothetical protein L6R37_004783 [Teloschistes peruensis]|nr:MAG: hypothetical protein L6R37_004783 [Teloschistes peruensis]
MSDPRLHARSEDSTALDLQLFQNGAASKEAEEHLRKLKEQIVNIRTERIEKESVVHTLREELRSDAATEADRNKLVADQQALNKAQQQLKIGETTLQERRQRDHHDIDQQRSQVQENLHQLREDKALFTEQCQRYRRQKDLLAAQEKQIVNREKIVDDREKAVSVRETSFTEQRDALLDRLSANEKYMGELYELEANSPFQQVEAQDLRDLINTFREQQHDLKQLSESVYSTYHRSRGLLALASDSLLQVVQKTTLVADRASKAKADLASAHAKLDEVRATQDGNQRKLEELRTEVEGFRRGKNPEQPLHHLADIITMMDAEVKDLKNTTEQLPGSTASASSRSVFNFRPFIQRQSPRNVVSLALWTPTHCRRVLPASSDRSTNKGKQLVRLLPPNFGTAEAGEKSGLCVDITFINDQQ